MTLIIGAVDMLARENAPHALAVPSCWAIGLNESDWEDNCKVALFHSTDLWVKPLRSTAPDFASAAPGQLIGVVRERSSGEGQNRMLHWEIIAVDPKTEDVLAEMARVGPASSGGALAAELSKAVSSRSLRPTSGQTLGADIA
mmetsp:Transcript_111242/g.175312  ORF Transcript_111242/g.175312 Transcript_111242/m.175312 type:complete len:143 (+) Transcript_111242:2-430(+)